MFFLLDLMDRFLYFKLEKLLAMVNNLMLR